MSTRAGPLERLAARRGVVVSYTDAFGKGRTVSPDTLVAVLRSLGEPIERPADAARCLQRLQGEDIAEPVAVAWDGRLDARLRERLSSPGGSPFVLELEDGGDGTDLCAGLVAGGTGFVPFGVHRLVTAGASQLLVSAPSRSPRLAPHSWGVFAPTYALVDDRLRATGDLTALERLGRFAAELGASYLATLPLLADYSALEEPGAVVSPYSPLSRLWWNEAFLDLSRLGVAPTAGPGVLAGMADPLHADVAAAAAVVDEALARLLENGYPGSGSSRRDLEAFRLDRPDVERYGAFRAAARQAGTNRWAWPARWRSGDIRPGEDVDAGLVELHVCAQWLTDRQLAEVAATTAAAGCALMLDLPIGSRPDGYDTWAFPASFAGEPGPAGATTVGAPPDQFFSSGQNWGFRPLHPFGEREAGYPVVRGALRHLLRHTGALRIDHILGFQRLWWIPPGAAAPDGAYVRYPTDELMALACLEAWRSGAGLVGEDLGTVDPAVREGMARHGVAGMSVAVFDLETRPGRPLRPPPGTCAFVDTHDTATFAGWLEGDDIALRQSLGLLDDEAAAAARRQRARATGGLARRLGNAAPAGRPGGAGRETSPSALHAAVLAELGASAAGVVITALEDLWAERDPQNVPGTIAQHRNFSRRMSRPLAGLETSADVREPLLRLDARRREATSSRAPRGAGAWHDAVAGKLQP